MPHQFSRRQFNQAAVAIPLAGLPVATSDVPNQKSLRLKVQCHCICVDGRHLEKDNWQIEFFVRVVQRMQADPRYGRGRIMTPSNAFTDRLNECGFDVVRRNPKRLVAERITLPNSVAGLCLMLESTFHPGQQDELWTDSTPESWDGHVVPDNRVVKRFWIGEVRT